MNNTLLASFPDMESQTSIENVTGWMENIISNASENIRVVLVGNKTDLRDEITRKAEECGGKKSEAQLDLEAKARKAVEIADGFNVPYIETSAKDSSGVDDAFASLVESMIGHGSGGGGGGGGSKNKGSAGGGKGRASQAGANGKKCVVS